MMADEDDLPGNPEPEETETEPGGIAADRLRSLVERIERLETEVKEVRSEIKDIYAEAKGAGFDVKVLRRIVRMRKMDPREIEEQDDAYDVYKSALGM